MLTVLPHADGRAGGKGVDDRENERAAAGGEAADDLGLRQAGRRQHRGEIDDLAARHAGEASGRARCRSAARVGRRRRCP